MNKELSFDCNICVCIITYLQFIGTFIEEDNPKENHQLSTGSCQLNYVNGSCMIVCNMFFFSSEGWTKENQFLKAEIQGVSVSCSLDTIW